MSRPPPPAFSFSTLELQRCSELAWTRPDVSGLWRAGGAQRTPLKQKMKTMSRSLQMLNVARLNVKALKNQPEVEQQEAPERPGRRCSERNKRREAPATRQCSTQHPLPVWKSPSVF